MWAMAPDYPPHRAGGIRGDEDLFCRETKRGRYGSTEQSSVLIVDDNASLCRVLSLILTHKGYSVTVASDGIEAVKEVRRRPFHITLMDVRMPHIDGLETFRRIRQIRPEAVVVMMTAYAVDAQVQAALQEKACGIFSKPLDIENMLAFIEKALA